MAPVYFRLLYFLSAVPHIYHRSYISFLFILWVHFMLFDSVAKSY